MKNAIGLSLAHDSIRAVLLRGDRLMWAAERQRDPPGVLADEIVELLGGIPGVRLRSAVVRVAVGASMAHMKMVYGLPTDTPPDILAQVIHQSRGRYFVEGETPLEITGVLPVGPGSVWAAAISSSVTESLRSVSQTLGIGKLAVLPAAVTLPQALVNEQITWADGVVRFEVTRSSDESPDIRRRSKATDSTQALVTVEGLAAVGDHADRFADAYGAAVLDVTSPWLRLSDAFTSRHEGPTWRLARMPVAIALTAILVAALSPLANIHSARQTDSQMETLRISELWRAGQATMEQLALADHVLARADSFQRSRSYVVPLLGEIARLLPGHAVLVRFELEGGHARVIVRSHDSDDVVKAFLSSPHVTNVERGPTGGVAMEHGWDTELRIEIANTAMLQQPGSHAE